MAEKKAAAKKAAEKYLKFDIKDLEAQPNDGDLCKVKQFDQEHGKTVDGPLAVFDQRRGVFFKEPARDDDGNLVLTKANPIGNRRDNYKAERLRNVTDYCVVKEGHDCAPPPDSVIDHRRGLEHASTRPASHNLPPDT